MNQYQFNDILNLPYPNPEIERDFPDKVLHAAQFAPFAALTGHDAAVEETARFTERETLLDESQKEELNRKLCFLKEQLWSALLVSVTYFVKDQKKEGGSYRTINMPIKKISESQKAILLEDGTKILMNDIVSLDCDLFPNEE